MNLSIKIENLLFLCQTFVLVFPLVICRWYTSNQLMRNPIRVTRQTHVVSINFFSFLKFHRKGIFSLQLVSWTLSYLYQFIHKCKTIAYTCSKISHSVGSWTTKTSKEFCVTGTRAFLRSSRKKLHTHRNRVQCFRISTFVLIESFYFFFSCGSRRRLDVEIKSRTHQQSVTNEESSKQKILFSFFLQKNLKLNTQSHKEIQSEIQNKMFAWIS